jgi:hypothetical protein
MFERGFDKRANLSNYGHRPTSSRLVKRCGGRLGASIAAEADGRPADPNSDSTVRHISQLMSHESILLRDVPGLYRAATTAFGRLHAAMLRYHDADGGRGSEYWDRTTLEEYVACGQIYRTTLGWDARGRRRSRSKASSGGTTR